MTQAAIGLAVAFIAASACRDVQQPPVFTGPTAVDSAEQVMFGVRFRLHSEGLNQAHLEADTALVFDEATRTEFFDVRLTFFNSAGAKTATLTSREGTYNTQLQRMQARGNVVVVGEDGRRLRTEQLQYDQREDRISSDSAFVLTEPDGRRLEGIGFVSDSRMSSMRCLRACSGMGGAVAVPTQ